MIPVKVAEKVNLVRSLLVFLIEGASDAGVTREIDGNLGNRACAMANRPIRGR